MFNTFLKNIKKEPHPKDSGSAPKKNLS